MQPAHSGPDNGTPSSLRQRAYRHIRHKLMAGELPAGHVLSENQLAREIGISRTPVREAILCLENEGVLQQVRRFGTVVRRLDRADLVELFDLREALEPFAASRAAGRLRPADADRLHALVAELKAVADETRAARRDVPTPAGLSRLLAADLAFHLLLLDAAGNRRLAEIVSHTRMLTRIFATPRQEHGLGVIRSVYREHRAILAAVQRGDADAARAAMLEHIAASKRQALESWDRHGGRGPDGDMPAEVLDALQEIEAARTAKKRRPRRRNTPRTE